MQRGKVVADSMKEFLFLFRAFLVSHQVTVIIKAVHFVTKLAAVEAKSLYKMRTENALLSSTHKQISYKSYELDNNTHTRQ